MTDARRRWPGWPRRWVAVVAVVVVAAATVGAYRWWTGREECADVVGSVDGDDRELPRFLDADRVPAAIEDSAGGGDADGAGRAEYRANGTDALLEPGDLLTFRRAAVVDSPADLASGGVLVHGGGAATMHDPANGELRWARSLDGESLGTLDAGDNVVQLQSDNAAALSLVELDGSTGDVRRCTTVELEMGDAIAGRFTGTDDSVIIAPPSDTDVRRSLQQVDRSTGEEGWSRRLEPAQRVSVLDASEDVVVVGGITTDLGDTEATSRLVAGYGTNVLVESAAEHAFAVQAFATDDGDEVWTYEPPTPAAGERPTTAALVGVTADVAVVIEDRSEVTEGDSEQAPQSPVVTSRVVGLDIATGEELWATDLVPSTALHPLGLFDGTVVVQERHGQEDNPSWDLVAVDAATGTDLWRNAVDGGYDLRNAATTGGSLYVPILPRASGDVGIAVVDLATGEHALAAPELLVSELEADGSTLLVQANIDLVFVVALYALD